MVKKQSILSTIRELLAFKDTTTISELAQYSGYTKQHVLAVINRNAPYVKRDRKSGRITGIELRRALIERLWESGGFYKQESYGSWSHEGYSLKFIDKDGLFDRLKVQRCIGGIGDSGTITIVLDTPENRAALEAAGIRPWSEAVIDDRLWSEDINKPLEGE